MWARTASVGVPAARPSTAIQAQAQVQAQAQAQAQALGQAMGTVRTTMPTAGRGQRSGSVVKTRPTCWSPAVCRAKSVSVRILHHSCGPVFK